MKYILVNYYWGKDVKSNNGMTFGELAERWTNNAKKLNIPHYIVYLPKLNGKYQQGINYKATFIKHMMKKFPDTAIVWSDVDMIFKKNPILFENPYNSDFMAFNWNNDPAVITNNAVDPYILETPAAIWYFANNSRVYKFLNSWEDALKSQVYKLQADDRILALVFHKFNMDKHLRCHWLPFEYLYIPQYFGHLKMGKNATILHDSDLTSEEDAHKKGAAKNRIPSDYKLQYKVRDRKNKKIHTFLCKHEQPLMKRMKQYGFEFVQLHTFPNVTTSCNQYIKLSEPKPILDLWNKQNCTIILNTAVKRIIKDSDIFTPHFQGKLLKFPSKNVVLYLNRSNGTLQLVKEWYDSKDHSLKSLENIFNSNINHYLQCRIN